MKYDNSPVWNYGVDSFGGLFRFCSAFITCKSVKVVRVITVPQLTNHKMIPAVVIAYALSRTAGVHECKNMKVSNKMEKWQWEIAKN